MPTALVVDDSRVDQLVAGGLLEKKCGMAVTFASNGQQALEMLAKSHPDVLLTDLQMPEMDGLELVEAVREQHPAVPVILMTAYGSEELAAEALRRGAAGYVPKRLLPKELEPTVSAVLAAAAAHGEQHQVLACVAELRHSLVLENDVALVQPLVAFLQRQVSLLSLCDETGVTRVGMALNEALSNAIHHGNLEVSSKLRESSVADYLRLLEERRHLPPWSARRTHVTATLTPAEAVFVVRDEGKGFDPSTLPDPKDPENLLKSSGRGVTLMRMFMDEVRFNATGNETTLVLRRES